VYSGKYTQGLAYRTEVMFTPASNATKTGFKSLRNHSYPRTRVFRARHGLRLRHIVVPAIAGIVLLASAAAWFSGTDETSLPAAHAPITAQAAAPDVVLQMSPEAPTTLREAFSMTPPAPAPIAVAAATAPAPAQKKNVSYIRASIDGILNAGGELLTSRKTLAVGKGDTLMELLVRNDVPRAEAYQAIAALSKVYNPRALNPGREITVFFHRDPSVADPQFSGLSIEKDVVSTVHVNREGDGGYTADQQDKPVHTALKGYRGKISNSLYVDAKNAGLPDNVIVELIRMYSFGVDFQREIQNNDTFEVMVEQEETTDGSAVPGSETVKYAKLALSGREMQLYRFVDNAGNVEYYDAKGQSAKKPLMKTPIDGARLSSGFGFRRHPVLGYNKMHKGIDFAAPRGTPIYAAGDGVIVKAGPFSSYGNYIKIRHRAGLETAYAHLKGFKAGLRAGSRVKQGQVIAYVGTTGRSTGPHLHYEVMIGGKQVNPSSLKITAGAALAGRDLKKFKDTVAQTARTFRTLGNAQAVASSQ
jgi:murein DD-endopeptidase MepM/ murein hydrolase activator NlpD